MSRAWGWGEYASDALYVVYFQIAQGGNHYFIVNVDGNSPGVPLAWSGGVITKLDCSPDGRAFAFLTDSDHLYVMNHAGLLYDSPEDRMYTTVSVANDGTTALFDAPEGRLLIDARRVNSQTLALATPERPGELMDRIDVSQQGLLLWSRDFADIRLISLANGAIVPSVAHGYSGQWLASGEMFTFSELVTDREGIGLFGGQFIMDMATQKVARIGDWTLNRPLSPDGTRVAGALAISSASHLAQVVVYDLFSDEHRLQLTHDMHIASQPICFLTFSPQMLLNNSQ